MLRFFFALAFISLLICGCSGYDSISHDGENSDLPSRKLVGERYMEANLKHLRTSPEYTEEGYYIELPQINFTLESGREASQSGWGLLFNLETSLQTREYSNLMESWRSFKFRPFSFKYDSLARAGLAHYANLKGHNEFIRIRAREATTQIFCQAMLFKLLDMTNRDAVWEKMFNYYSSVLINNKYAANPILWHKLFESGLLAISNEKKREIAIKVVSNPLNDMRIKKLIDLSVRRTLYAEARENAISAIPDAKALIAKEDRYNLAFLAEYMPAHNYLVRLAGTGQVLE